MAKRALTLSILLTCCGTEAGLLNGVETTDAQDIANRNLAYFAGDNRADTAVTIAPSAGQSKFLINGDETYSRCAGVPQSSHGMLMNNRMVNATIDDMDGQVASFWNDPSPGKPENNYLAAGDWNARDNTRRFIESMAVWREFGAIAHTLNFQGGCQCTENIAGNNQSSIDNNPFGATGTQCFDDYYAGIDSARARYLTRIGSVIRAADDLGVVIILGLFYFGQDERIAQSPGDANIYSAVESTVEWVIRNGWTNVLIEVGNESSIGWYEHDILREPNVHLLVDHIHELTNKDGTGDSIGFSYNPNFSFPDGKLLTSVSGAGGHIPSTTWLERVDFALLHGNGRDPGEIETMVNQTRSRIAGVSGGNGHAIPVVFNEDDGQVQNGPGLGSRIGDPSSLSASYEQDASWGLYYDYYHQTVYPPRWEPWGNAGLVARAYRSQLGFPAGQRIGAACLAP